MRWLCPGKHNRFRPYSCGALAALFRNVGVRFSRWIETQDGLLKRINSAYMGLRLSREN